MVYGQTATWTATVTGYETPTGTVSFYFGAVNPADLVGTANLFVAGGVDEAILNVSGLPASSGYSVTAVYNGDTSNEGSTSNTVTQVVTPAPLVITANDQTMTTGAPRLCFRSASPGSSMVIRGRRSSRGRTWCRAVTTVSATSDAGSYAIDVSVFDPNYVITYVPGTLTINPAPLVITPDDETMTYGGTLPALLVSYSGLVNGDTPDTFSIGSNAAPTATTVAATSDAGSYAINAVMGFSTPTTTLPTCPAHSPSTRPRSSSRPTMRPRFTAPPSQPSPPATRVSLTVTLRLRSRPCRSSPRPPRPATRRTYAITAGGAADANYTISYVAGDLTITPAPLDHHGQQCDQGLRCGPAHLRCQLHGLRQRGHLRLAHHPAQVLHRRHGQQPRRPLRHHRRRSR